jgi:polyhydroxyalkanoate synthase
LEADMSSTKAQQPGTHASGGDAHTNMTRLVTQHWDRQCQLWQSFAGAGHPGAGQTGASLPQIVQPAPGDRRFDAQEWQQHPWYAALMQSYLLNADMLRAMTEAVDVTPKAREQLRFLTRQFIDAACPANSLLTNPEAVRLALESGGESLRTGLANWLADASRG